MKCKPRKYANGGKVSEYGKPTFLSSLKSQFGLNDDGYGGKVRTSKPRVAAVEKVANVVAKRKKILDDL